jgi:hypothetical protein
MQKTLFTVVLYQLLLKAWLKVELGDTECGSDAQAVFVCNADL